MMAVTLGVVLEELNVARIAFVFASTEKNVSTAPRPAIRLSVRLPVRLPSASSVSIDFSLGRSFVRLSISPFGPSSVLSATPLSVSPFGPSSVLSASHPPISPFGSSSVSRFLSAALRPFLRPPPSVSLPGRSSLRSAVSPPVSLPVCSNDKQTMAIARLLFSFFFFCVSFVSEFPICYPAALKRASCRGGIVLNFVDKQSS